MLLPEGNHSTIVEREPGVFCYGNDWRSDNARVRQLLQGRALLCPRLGRSVLFLNPPAEVIQSMLQSKLQESVYVLDPTNEVLDLEALAQKYAKAKVILVILTQGLLQDSLFAGAIACCPVEVRGNLVPIKADENFIYPDPAFWEKLAAGEIFSAATLAKHNTDFEGVRSAYARLFNVLALKFTSHGSESIQSTEIQVMKGRLAPMLAAEVVASVSMPKKQDSKTYEEDTKPAKTLKIEKIEPVQETDGMMYPEQHEIQTEAGVFMSAHVGHGLQGTRQPRQVL